MRIGTQRERRLLHAALCVALVVAFGILPRLRAQLEKDLDARARVLPDVGAGVRALKRDASNRIYVLSAASSAVRVYNPDGKFAREIPATPSKQNSIVSGRDMDVDSTGRVYVADRAANMVRGYAADGTPSAPISIDSPMSVVSLPEGEIAVASVSPKRLVAVFDAHGKLLREFGELAEVAERPELNRMLNAGRLAADAAGNIYYAFSFLPEPTFRQYSRAGRLASEVELAIPEFEPRATALRREIDRQEHSASPSFHPIINAIAADPENGRIWVAVGNEVLVFDADGIRRASYRVFSPDGAVLEPGAILVEPDRLLLGADPLGIFEFARPDKTSGTR